MKTLLIDDDEWIRDSMRLYFDGEGCHLLAVETAEEGMEKLSRQNYDVIIVDYRLPGMDGLEFLGRIRNSHPNALTMLITAYGNREVFLKASNLGVQGFIDKPFTIERLEAVLSRLIQNKEDKVLLCKGEDMEKQDKWLCAHCGYTSDGRFEGDICPQCGLTYWKCFHCGFTVTAAIPPSVCPECGENCAFINITCYTPECGGPGHIDPRL